MSKHIIHTNDAPAAIGPYSQAIQVGPLFYTTGQIPIDPGTGKVIKGDIEIQTRRVMDNLGALLAAAGLSFNDVIKTTIFIRDMDQFAAINKIYGAYFSDDPPVRSTVQVSRLPLDVDIE
ncbi:MAG: RidA family protein, partial [Anaerolineales bacterium]|nr:RidA family protein [Anaerolineales bacterium]